MIIASLQLKNRPLFLAPMEDYTDRPFRLICRRLGADVVVTEFTSAEALIRDVEKAKDKIRLLPEERPAGIQIFGAREEAVAEAARVAEQFQPDFIDINAGCSAGKHAGRGEGAGLLRDLPRFERIVRAAVKAVKTPVTVKTRLGWDHDSIIIEDVARMVEAAGARCLTLHCRTKKQAYKGKADWSWLEKVRRLISIPLIGNGDVTEPDHARQLFDLGCDGVMIGRGAVANPWIFRQTRHYLETGRHLPPPDLKERVGTCLEHLRLFARHNDISRGLYAFRKFYSGYIKGIPGVARFRNELMTLNDLDAIEQRFRMFYEERKNQQMEKI
ncbi:MAG: tRNA dihydrouridine synthase DusB [Candidatus Omnitrophota bacterium]